MLIDGNSFSPKPDSMPSGLLERYAGIVEPALRAPFHSGGIWLVRPDGYVALSARSGSWDAVETYLDHLRGEAAEK